VLHTRAIIIHKFTPSARNSIVRLVVLYQASDIGKHQPGYQDGFIRLKQEGVISAYRGIPYISVAQEMGWDGMWAEAERLAAEIQADAVFLQFFHDYRMNDPAPGIARIRALPSRPTIFSSVGDGFGRWGKRIPNTYKIAAMHSDVNFLTSMGYLAEELSRFGAKNIVLMPNGVCQLRFSAPLDRDHYAPVHDVVFIGNLSRTKNPLSDLFWNERHRRKLVGKLSTYYGAKFAVYGKNWTGPNAHGVIDYADQHSIIRRSRVVIGGYPYVWCDYYTSDRVLVALASGIPFVDFAVPMVDNLFEDGRDWWLAISTDEMIAKCNYLLERSDEERLNIAARTREMILQEQTQYHRCRQMMEIVASVRKDREAGLKPPPPTLKFLRMNSSNTNSPAVQNWVG
jgi:glycosyltransferase involved in cell wall biosynthesis